jgi:Fur family transcriptional regulator, ferric uptake regulator
MTVVERGSPRVVRDLDDVAAAVREAGGRLTSARRAVVEALFAAADDALTAEQIAEGVAGRRLDLASVYRNLERLEELGVVRHVHLGHGAGVYALSRGSGRDYLVCERCARVTTVELAKLAEARAEIRRVTGYTANFTHFPIHGLCRRCAGRATRDAGERLTT